MSPCTAAAVRYHSWRLVFTIPVAVFSVGIVVVPVVPGAARLPQVLLPSSPLSWWLPILLSASSTHSPPCEQFLTGVGVGAWLFDVAWSIPRVLGVLVLVGLVLIVVDCMHLQSTLRAVAHRRGTGVVGLGLICRCGGRS